MTRALLSFPSTPTRSLHSLSLSSRFKGNISTLKLNPTQCREIPSLSRLNQPSSITCNAAPTVGLPEGLRLDNPGPEPGSRKNQKRKGGGIAAGQGNSCGFGMRGQKSHSNPGVSKSFEGGQMPLRSQNLAQKPPHRLLEERLISLLQSCKASKQLYQIQTQVFTNGFEFNDYINPKILSAFAEIKRMDYARKVFDRIPDPNAPIWNAMLRGYSKSECHREVIALFCAMKGLDLIPNCFTYPVVIKSCGKIKAFVEGEEVHCLLMKNGFMGNIFVGTSLIDMYSSGGFIRAAYRVFGEMLEKNLIVWTAMINGYISCQDMVSAQELFDLAPERDVVLWNIVIVGYIKLGDMEKARELFDEMPRRDVMCWNTMLNGYARNGNVEACKELFEEMPEKNIFSWNALVGGYAHNGCFSDVLSSFKRMLIEACVPPNDATLVSVLTACARLGALDLGKWAHLYADNAGYKGNVFVRNALIDMYSKCGVIESAVKVFDSMDLKDLITWNSVICGMAMHGHGAEALNLFLRMKDAGEKPDNITFVGVLCACAHLGLVEEGLSYFQSMIDEQIVPHIEHYGCVVDLLARAGLFDQAMHFVKNMSMEADAVIWAALLGACKTYKNIELAEVALERLIQLEPNNPANFVMLSNIYGELGRWKDVARLKVAMKATGFKKLPACSLIEVNGTVVEFYSLDERHPFSDEIYNALSGLTKLLRSSACMLDLMELGLLA